MANVRFIERMTKVYQYFWPRAGTKRLTIEEISDALSKKGLRCKEQSGRSGPELILEGYDVPVVLAIQDGLVVGAGLQFDLNVSEEEALCKIVTKALKTFGWSGMLSSNPAKDLPPSITKDLPPSLASALGTRLNDLLPEI